MKPLAPPTRRSPLVRRPLRHAAALFAVGCLTLAGAAAAKDRVLRETIELTPGQDVELELPVGELDVIAVDGNELEMTLEVRCKSRSCGDRAERIRFDIDSGDGYVSLEVDGYPMWGKSKLDYTATLRVPRGHEVELEVGVGEVDVRGIDSDLHVELGVGDLQIEVPEAIVRSVSLEAGVGDASLRYAGGGRETARRHIVGAEVEWHDGPGDVIVKAEVGVGEVSARLTELR